jgi:hypothetical protein
MDGVARKYPQCTHTETRKSPCTHTEQGHVSRAEGNQVRSASQRVPEQASAAAYTYAVSSACILCAVICLRLLRSSASSERCHGCWCQCQCQCAHQRMYVSASGCD